jgi:hypothetical protein
MIKLNPYPIQCVTLINDFICYDADYADDKVIIFINNDPITASSNLQIHLNYLSEWYDKWRVKINQNKSVHTTFKLKQGICPNITLKNVQIPTSDTVKYLGLILDVRLTWNKHLRTKRITLNNHMHMLRHLIIRNKFSTLNTKLLIYKSLLKPIWTYGLQQCPAIHADDTIKKRQWRWVAIDMALPQTLHGLNIHIKFCDVITDIFLLHQASNRRLKPHPISRLKRLCTLAIFTFVLIFKYLYIILHLLFVFYNSVYHIARLYFLKMLIPQQHHKTIKYVHLVKIAKWPTK